MKINRIGVAFYLTHRRMMKVGLVDTPLEVERTESVYLGFVCVCLMITNFDALEIIWGDKPIPEASEGAFTWLEKQGMFYKVPWF